MNQLTLETNSVVDMQLLLSLAKRLNIKIVNVETSSLIVDEIIENEEVQSLLEASTAFDFLKVKEEDIYTDADLKPKPTLIPNN